MRAPAVSFAKRFAAAALAALLTFTLVPSNAFAEGEGDSPSTEEAQDVNSIQAEEAAGASPRRVVASSQGLSAPLALPDLGSTPAASSAEGGTLAASLMGRPISFVNADVALDGEPVIGSFTVDGLTFAVTGESTVELVGVSNPEAIGLTPTASEAEADGLVLALPESITYDDVEYAVTSIGAYAFYLSGVTAVELPASVTDVDDRAFRSSDVASVEVAEGNPAYSSFDGALYDADQLSLLLIPEGKQGTVLLPSTAESASPSVFSHCSLVTQISVEEGSAAFASENGLLYDASLETLLRAPAGATDITIREGCTTIAAGALEACASLATINASASVASISPDVFTAIPTVSLLAASLVGAGEFGTEGEPSSQDAAPQLTAMVALSSADDDLPDVDCSRITVRLMPEGSAGEWERTGFTIAADEAMQLLDEGDEFDAPIVEGSLQSAETYGANTFTIRNCFEEESSDLFYYISVSKISTSANTITLGGSAGFNHFNNLTFGGGPASQWQMYNTPYGMYVERADGKAFLLSRFEFDSSFPTSFTSASTYLSYYTPWECAYYVKTDGTVVKQPANYQSFYWDQVSAVYVTPGPSILETYHYNDGTGRTHERWIAAKHYWPRVLSISRTGHTSQGWWDAASGGTKYADMGAEGPYYRNVIARTTRSYYAHWAANSYTIEYWNKAGTTKLSSDANFKYDTARNLAAKPSSGITAGYTAVGWATSANQSSKSYDFGSSQKNLTTSGTKKLYLAETANSYTVEYWNKAGTTKLSTDTGFKYDTARNLAAKPSSGVSAGYTAVGWATSTNQTKANYSFGSSQKNLATSGTKKLYLAETANSYTVEYWNKAGTTKLSTDTGFKYDTARNLAAKPSSGVSAGYTAVGWATATNQSTAAYGFSSSQKNLATSGTKKLYLAETANPITLAWNSNGGSAVASTTQTYSPTAKVALPANPTRTGYTFAGWWTAATGGIQVTSSTALPTASTTYHAHWSLNPYSIAYELNGGTVSGNPTTYSIETIAFTLKNPTRQGYVFTGWSGTGLTGDANMAVTIPQGSTGNRSYTAHWLPAISADIPLEVTAQVDLLGIEEQEEAQGYIESRCGEPLGVADVAFTPLSGADELFGVTNVADVALEVLAAGSTSPDARFALDASASQAPATPAAFRMASYGSRVPISYRFDIPEALLPTLVEATKPVCSVAYTVALA